MNPTVGIVGGGQIGKMITQAASRLNLSVVVLDPTPNCPAAKAGATQIQADFKNPDALRDLASKCDVLTYEIELGDTQTLREIESSGKKVYPSSDCLKIIQDKGTQKQFLADHKIPVPEFAAVHSADEIKSVTAKIGFPSLLKLRRDTYDGRGSFTFRNPRELSDLLNAHTLNGSLSKDDYMLERFVPFTKEISVMIARNAQGKTVHFPVVENIHKDHILVSTLAPARISPKLAAKACAIARKAVEKLKGVGIFGVEMFLDKKGGILINEIAPRPHNSGHYTIEACTHSQFEIHLRAILGLPLIEPRLLSPAVLINILGTRNFEGPSRVKGLEQALSVPGASVHIYGKEGSRVKRKLGHATVLDKTLAGAMAKAEKIRKCLEVVPA